MRILQLGKHYYPVIGGIESVIRELAEGLAARGVNVDVIGCNTSLKHEESVIAGVKVTRCSRLAFVARTSISVDLIARLAARVDSYDVVHIHHPDPMAALALFAARPKCRVVLHWHCDIVKQKFLLGAYRPLQEWLLKRADVIVAGSPPLSQTSADLVRYEHKTTVIPFGMNTKRLRVDETLLQALRKKYFGKRIVFSLGRLAYYKGYRYLVEAMESLPQDVVLLIGGEGELHDELLSLTRRLNLTSRVSFLGRLDEDALGAHYQICDVFCLPSIARTEAFGLVLLEAMAHRKPLVTTTLAGSGMSWVNIDGVSGLSAPPEDSAALASVLSTLLSNRAFATECGVRAFERFNRLFTSNAMVDQFLRLYEGLARPLTSCR